MEAKKNGERSRFPDEFFYTCVLKGILTKMEKTKQMDIILEWGVNTKSVDDNEAPILHLAIELGLLFVVIFLIDNGVSASATDKQGNSVLHVLSTSDSGHIIKKVTSFWNKSGQEWMPLNKKNHSPIGNSLYHKNVSLTKILLEELTPKDFPGQKVLAIPIQRHFHEGLELLIAWQKRNRASPTILVCGSRKSPFQEAIRAKNERAFQLLLEAKEQLEDAKIDPETWIPSLAECGNLRMISAVLKELRDEQRKKYLQEIWSHQGTEKGDKTQYPDQSLKEDKELDQEQGQGQDQTYDKNMDMEQNQTWNKNLDEDQNKAFEKNLDEEQDQIWDHAHNKGQVGEQKITRAGRPITDRTKSQETEPIKRHRSEMQEEKELHEKDINQEERKTKDINCSKTGIKQEKQDKEEKDKSLQKNPLQKILKYRDHSRKAEYLREHLLLAINDKMTEEALLFLQFAKKLFSEVGQLKEYWEQILFKSHEMIQVADTEPSDDSDMTPLVKSISNNLDPVSQKLIDLEREFLGTKFDESTPSNDEVRAHHASRTTHPGHVQLCLGIENPSNEILKLYFKYLVKAAPLIKRMEGLSPADRVHFLKLHRQWAVQVFDHSMLHQVTNALVILKDKKKIVCESHTGNVKLLQLAVRASKRLIIGELLHQEYLRHGQENSECKIECLRCIKEQLTHDNNVSYVIDTLDSFFPETNIGKLGIFVMCHILPCSLSAILMWSDIYLDMSLTKKLYNQALNATEEIDKTKYNLAFHISWASQLLPLITSIPLWIWKMMELLESKFQISSSCQGFCTQDKEMTSQPPEQRPLMENKSMSPSNIEWSSASKWERLIKTLFVVFPPLVAVLAFTVCIFVHDSTMKLSIVGASNSFTGTLIFCLILARLSNRKQFIFNEDDRKPTLRNQFQVMERQYALATIGESCLEAIVQLSLQIWLLSSEDFAHDFDKGFISRAILTLRSLISSCSERQGAFRNQLVIKLLMSCSSLIFSVCGSYRFLKYRSMNFHHLIFVFFALNLQLWARMSVIFAWCINMTCSVELQIGGVGIFLALNILFVFFLSVSTTKFISRTPLTYQNILVIILEGIASSMLLVRIPKVKQDNEIISGNTFTLQVWYFFGSFVINILWIFCIQSCGKVSSLCWTFVEIVLLFVTATVFQTLYYTTYGHPWRSLIRDEIQKRICPTKKNV